MTSPVSRFISRFVALALVITAAVAWGTTYQIIQNFSGFPQGNFPNGGLISDAAGNLYGVTAFGGHVGTGGVYKLSQKPQGGWTETVIYSFGFTGSANPQYSLTIDARGNLYGIGTSGFGSVFKLTPKANGQWSESEIWSFENTREGGPVSGLIVDAKGNLYGEAGVGANKCGAVYRLSRGANGKWSDTILYSFQCSGDGSGPVGGLVFDASGNLYGTADGGGGGHGVVFELTHTPGGWSESVLHAFAGGPDGSIPVDAVTLDGAGNVFGSTAAGGTGTACGTIGCGVIFELVQGSSGEWTESILHSFNDADGKSPRGSLAIDQEGNLFGTTSGGGSADQGTAFELKSDTGGQWTEQVLWSFTGDKDGRFPTASVILGPAGQIYGCTGFNGGLNGNGTVFELIKSSGGTWQEKTLTNFADGSGDPVGLTPDGAGNFYGATNAGGANGQGVIYTFSRDVNGKWSGRIIYAFETGFVSNGQAFGASPSSLILDASGRLYGETQYGGKNGKGTVFRLSPVAGGSWTYQDLYDFKGGLDGVSPQGGLIFDSTGNLYGTTRVGGSGTACAGSGCGTVFELSQNGGTWSKTILYSFQGGTDGAHSTAPLVFDATGNLFGVTKSGGTATACSGGCGTLFELSRAAGEWTEAVLHTFTATKGDGALPAFGLTSDSAGNLFGATIAGGVRGICGAGCGTIFQFTPADGSSSLKIIYEFPEAPGPRNALAIDGARNLFGVTAGMVYELSPASGGEWTVTTLHTFGATGNGDGSDPVGTLVFGAGGNLYGTTANGGISSGGTIFEITP